MAARAIHPAVQHSARGARAGVGHPERGGALQTAKDELASATRQVKETQDQFVQNEKLAALHALVPGAAHEMNAPLGNALLATTRLDDQTQQLQADVAAGQLLRSRLGGYIQDSVHA